MKICDTVGAMRHALTEPPPIAPLPDYLLRILQGLARGRSIVEIAADLYATPKTVRNYLCVLYGVLNLRGLPNPRTRAAVLGWYLMRDYPELAGYPQSAIGEA